VEVNSNLSQYQIMLASVKKGSLPSGPTHSRTQSGSENTFINIVSSQHSAAVQKQWQTAEIYQPGSRDYQASADIGQRPDKTFGEALQGR